MFVFIRRASSIQWFAVGDWEQLILIFQVPFRIILTEYRFLLHYSPPE